MHRRSLLKLFGVGAGAAVAPWALNAKEQGPPPPSVVEEDPSEFGILLITDHGQHWGPGVKELSHDGMMLKIDFDEWNPDRAMTVKGCHLIHKPTKTKYDYQAFRSAPAVVPGDCLFVTYRTPMLVSS